MKNKVLNDYSHSSNKHKVFTGLVNVELGNCTCTDQTFLSIPLLIKIFWPTDHKEQCWCSFFIITRSFSLKSRFSRFHFLQIFNIGKYCIKHFQNLLLHTFTALQCTRLTISSLFNVNGNDCLPSIKWLDLKHYNHLGHQ